MNDLEFSVLEALKGRYGKARAISRNQLQFDVGHMMDLPADQKIGDSSIRGALENLRRTHPIGALIVSSPMWEGYWLARDLDEVKDFAYRKRRTAAKMFQSSRLQINLARGQLKELEAADPEPQLKMFA